MKMIRKFWTVIVATRRVTVQTSARKPSSKTVKGLSMSGKVEDKSLEESKSICRIRIRFSNLTMEVDDPFIGLKWIELNWNRRFDDWAESEGNDVRLFVTPVQTLILCPENWLHSWSLSISTQEVSSWIWLSSYLLTWDLSAHIETSTLLYCARQTVDNKSPSLCPRSMVGQIFYFKLRCRPYKPPCIVW